ncbi:hypothetical protein NQ317_003547 [Molorchus minor]|uniref:CCHC-type domain-containing protein n=1 Tax=Molorchus minor TaxID=1323400 RepID=A0ABQ9IX07_9CUCU|nr:hypothetical protein NQ317_003547 [Molorchus minor]
MDETENKEKEVIQEETEQATGEMQGTLDSTGTKEISLIESTSKVVNIIRLDEERLNAIYKENILDRSGLLNRLERCNSLSDERRIKKRKIGDTSLVIDCDQNSSTEKVESNKIGLLAKERNTKKEIKEAAVALTNLMEKIKRKEIQALLQGLDNTKIAAGDPGQLKPLLEENLELRKELGKTPVHTNEMGDPDRPQTTETEKKLLMEIEAVASLADFERIADREWPKKAFSTAFVATGSLLQAPRDADLLVFAEEEVEGDPRSKEIMDRYPELGETEGKRAELSIVTRLSGTAGQEKTLERVIYMGRIEDEEDAVSTPDRQKGWTRKMTECIFKEAGIKCLIFNGNEKARVQGKCQNRNTCGESNQNDSRDQRRPNVNRYGLERRGVHKRIKKQISEDKIVKTLGRDGDKTGTIKDLDCVSTKEEVEMAIAHLLGIKEEEVAVGPLRPYFGGNQAATVRLKANHAVELLNKGTVRIGLNQCPINEFVKVVQCYRCLKYGHRRDECREATGRAAECLRCGGNGHKAKECERAEHCVLCQKDGHRAGAGKCPEFRKALQRSKAQAKKKGLTSHPIVIHSL